MIGKATVTVKISEEFSAVLILSNLKLQPQSLDSILTHLFSCLFSCFVETLVLLVFDLWALLVFNLTENYVILLVNLFAGADPEDITGG